MEAIMAKRIRPDDLPSFRDTLETAQVLPLWNAGENRRPPGAWAMWNCRKNLDATICAPAGPANASNAVVLKQGGMTGRAATTTF